MNEVIKNIETRRSIRKFKNDMPSKEDIKQIVDSGLHAPSGMSKQATITLVITNKELRDKLSKANCKIGGWKEGFDPFYNAPVVLVVLADKAVPTYVYDGSLVMENMMLAANSLGLGSIWIHRAKEEFEMAEFKEVLKNLGINGDYEGIGNMALGYVDGDMPNAHEIKEGRVFYID